MFTQKYRQNIKIISLIFALALIFLAEPAFAKKAQQQKVKTDRDTVKTQPTQKDNLPAANINRPAPSAVPETKAAPQKLQQKTNRSNALKSQPQRASSVKSNRTANKKAQPRTVAKKPKRTAKPETTYQKATKNSGIKVAKTSEVVVKSPGPETKSGRLGRQHTTKPFDKLTRAKSIKKLISKRPKTARADEGTTDIRRTNVDNNPDTKQATVTSGPSTSSTRASRTRRAARITQLSSARRLTQTKAVESQVRYAQRLRHIHARHNPGTPFRTHTRRIYHRVIWPKYRYIIHYNYGPRLRFRYFYPHYHRKYVFVSIGGYWPIGYNYLRYYWYGWHPYYWYGCYPSAYSVDGDTYNYYTYNYGSDGTTAPYQDAATGIRPVDENTFADVREKLARQAAEKPDEETLTDQLFDEAVGAFEDGDYQTAVDKFAAASENAPEDMVLPFAQIQALVAAERYSEAVEILRPALANLPPDEQGVFFPRGLYAEDTILFEQIDRLAEKAELYSFDADLQLLLGYQKLGVDQFDQASTALTQAGRDIQNEDSATILLSLVEKIKADTAEGTGPDDQ